MRGGEGKGWWVWGNFERKSRDHGETQARVLSSDGPVCEGSLPGTSLLACEFSQVPEQVCGGARPSDTRACC